MQLLKKPVKLMVLLMQCCVKNFLRPFVLQNITMSTQEVQNYEGVENEEKQHVAIGLRKQESKIFQC